jgi:hypothetical protein
MTRLALIGVLLALPLSAQRAMPPQEEGSLVSRADLVTELPVNADHPVPRTVIAAEEQEISCRPLPKKSSLFITAPNRPHGSV